MRSFVGVIFLIFGIMTIFSDAPLWDAITQLGIGYLFLDKESE